MGRFWSAARICPTRLFSERLMKNVAPCDILHVAVAAHLEWTQTETFVSYSLIQEGAERVIPEDADAQWRPRVLCGHRLPVDELCEVEQEYGLQLMLGRSRALHEQHGRDQGRDHV